MVISISLPLGRELFFGCWNCVSRHASYFKDPAGQLAALRTAQEDLQDAKQGLMQKVRLAEHGGRSKRLDQVDRWCTRVDELTRKADDVIAEATRDGANSTCFGSGTCLFTGNCFSRYRLGRKIAQTKSKLFAVTAEGSFDNVAKRLIVPLPTARAYEPPVGFETLLENVLGNLNDEHVGIIGLYGMGGIGKTTLLTQIHEAYVRSSSHDFDHVIWVEVEMNQSLHEVQHSIGKKIGFNEEMQAQSIEDRCEDISRELNGKKFILMLDNLWEKLDLVKAGVPLPTQENGCKIIFTTRSEIICGRMDAKKKIKLNCLDTPEAWELFRKKVGDDEILSNPDINELAREIVKECGGVPLALSTVGRTMSYKKTRQEWSKAIATLKEDASKFSGMDKDVLPPLKLSYDNLPSDTIKACLLRFSLNHGGPQRKIMSIREWFDEGLIGEGASDIEAFQGEGYGIIGTLISSSLLEVVPGNEDQVQMHEMIRHMLVWVACNSFEEDKKFFVQNGLEVTKKLRVANWQGARVASLMKHNIREISEIPTCPNLEALYLSHNVLERIIPGFFGFMSNLRVLDLSHNQSLAELPTDLTSLVLLEHLNLEHTGISELPDVLQNLDRLRVLNINNTRNLTLIPLHLLSKLSALQVFRMCFYNMPPPVETTENNNVLAGGNELLIEEVRQLSHLIEAELTIRSRAALRKYFEHERLMFCTTHLRLQSLQGSALMVILFPKRFKHLEWLKIVMCETLESIGLGGGEGSSVSGVPNSGVKCIPSFKKLTYICVIRCGSLKDLTAFAFLPNLERFKIESCYQIEEVIVGCNTLYTEAHQIPFAKLTDLRLTALPNLTSICHEAVPFTCLKTVYILGCPKLKRLPVHSDRVHGPKISIMVEEDRWNELQWEGETKSAFIPQFSTLSEPGH